MPAGGDPPMPMTLLMLHGWGFDATLWDRLAQLLPGYRIALADRGYFGAPVQPELSGPVIAVAHSFGAMRALRNPPPQCRGLIAINGFDCFTARGDAPGVPPRVLDRMLARFGADPVAVLTDFLARCGTAEPIGTPDTAILAQDLLALRNQDCRENAARWSLPILSLQGAHDPILPLALRDQVFDRAGRVQRLTHPDAGHLLPLSHADYCARQIADFAGRLG